MTKYFAIALLLGTQFISNAQNSHIYHSLKYAMFTEASWSPVILSEFSVDPSGPTDVHSDSVYLRPFGGITLLSYIYTFRVNVIDFNEELSLGINASPALSITMSNYGFGGANIPVYATINFGAGSTYETGKNTGGYFGLGYEYNMTNIIKTDEYPSTNVSDYYYTHYNDFRNNWGQTMIIGGVRWWGKSEKLQEVSFKYGFGKNGDDIPKSVTKDLGRPFSIQLSYGVMLNY